MVRRTNNRAVGFSLDVLVGAVDHGQEAAARDALTTLQGLSVRSIVLSTENQECAERRLDTVGLCVDEVYGGLTMRPQRTATLGQLGVWGYISDQISDIRAAKNTPAQAIAIKKDDVPPSDLRRAGADRILAGLHELPAVFSHDPETYANLQESSEALGISTHRLSKHLRMGHLPVVRGLAENRRRHPRSFLADVLQFTGGQQPSADQIRFCSLAWFITHGTFAEYRQAEATLKDLIASGEVMRGVQVARLLGYERHTVPRWIRSGILPAIRLKKDYYSIAKDVYRVKQTADGLVAEEAAAMLGMHKNSVARLAVRGALRASYVPNGLRVDEHEVARVVAERAKKWQAPKVREELGISQSTLSSWCKMGVLQFTMIGCRRQFDPQEVMALKARQSHSS